MKEKILVQMTEQSLFDFMLFHTYSKFAGFLSNVLGMAVAFMGVILLVMHKTTVLQFFIYLIAAAVFIGFTPVQLRMRAKKQVRINPEYKEECSYLFDEERLTKEQSGKETVFEWKQIEKVVSTPKTIGFYYKKDHALIIPKESFGNQFAPIMQIVVRAVGPSKMMIR